MPNDSNNKRPPPRTAKELLERYAEGERDFADTAITGFCAEGADLGGVNLVRAYLPGAQLPAALLFSVNLGAADLRKADLRKARLMGADLSNSELQEASLRGADLIGADLSGATLTGTDLGGALLGRTKLVDVDLTQVKNLHKVHHVLPSTLSLSTLAVLARQGSADLFLRGCGLSDWEIAASKLHQPALVPEQVADLTSEIHQLRADSPIQINPLFISYSHADSAFVDAIEKLFEVKGIRYWRDVHDMKAGRMEKQIERAITLNPTVLIVLSKDSVESDWVEDEVKKARELEKDSERDVLCPLVVGMTPGDALQAVEKKWGSSIRRQIEKYHILDFSDWKDEAVMKTQFSNLVAGLKLFYEDTSSAVRSNEV